MKNICIALHEVIKRALSTSYDLRNISPIKREKKESAISTEKTFPPIIAFFGIRTPTPLVIIIMFPYFQIIKANTEIISFVSDPTPEGGGL